MYASERIGLWTHFCYVVDGVADHIFTRNAYVQPTDLSLRFRVHEKIGVRKGVWISAEGNITRLVVAEDEGLRGTRGNACFPYCVHDVLHSSKRRLLAARDRILGEASPTALRSD